MARAQWFIADGQRHYGITEAAHKANVNNGKKSKGRPRDLQGDTLVRVETAYWKQVANYDKMQAEGASPQELKANKPTGLWMNRMASQLRLKATEWSSNQTHGGDGGRKGRRYIAYFKQKGREGNRVSSPSKKTVGQKPLTKQIIPKRRVAEERNINGETTRDEVILEFLKGTFGQWKNKEAIYFGRTSRKLWFRFGWSDKGRLILQFCKPDQQLEGHLVKIKTGFYLDGDLSAREAIQLIEKHASAKESE